MPGGRSRQGRALGAVRARPGRSRPAVTGAARAGVDGEGGQTLVLWYDTEHKDHDVDGAAAFVLRARAPNHGRMRVHMLPAATMASTVHHGSYATIGDAHEVVLQWVEAHGHRIAGPDREVNIYNAQPIRRDDQSYVTEVQYRVEESTRTASRRSSIFSSVLTLGRRRTQHRRERNTSRPALS